MHSYMYVGICICTCIYICIDTVYLHTLKAKRGYTHIMTITQSGCIDRKGRLTRMVRNLQHALDPCTAEGVSQFSSRESYHIRKLHSEPEAETTQVDVLRMRSCTRASLHPPFLYSLPAIPTTDVALASLCSIVSVFCANASPSLSGRARLVREALLPCCTSSHLAFPTWPRRRRSLPAESSTHDERRPLAISWNIYRVDRE